MEDFKQENCLDLIFISVNCLNKILPNRDIVRAFLLDSVLNREKCSVIKLLYFLDRQG